MIVSKTITSEVLNFLGYFCLLSIFWGIYQKHWLLRNVWNGPKFYITLFFSYCYRNFLWLSFQKENTKIECKGLTSIISVGNLNLEWGSILAIWILTACMLNGSDLESVLDCKSMISCCFLFFHVVLVKSLLLLYLKNLKHTKMS